MRGPVERAPDAVGRGQRRGGVACDGRGACLDSRGAERADRRSLQVCTATKRNGHEHAFRAACSTFEEVYPHGATQKIKKDVRRVTCRLCVNERSTAIAAQSCSHMRVLLLAHQLCVFASSCVFGVVLGAASMDARSHACLHAIGKHTQGSL